MSTLDDGMHPALHAVRQRHRRLFTGIPTMHVFMWQDDLVGGVVFSVQFLEKIYSASPMNEGQALDQP